MIRPGVELILGSLVLAASVLMLIITDHSATSGYRGLWLDQESCRYLLINANSLKDSYRCNADHQSVPDFSALLFPTKIDSFERLGGTLIVETSRPSLRSNIVSTHGPTIDDRYTLKRSLSGYLLVTKQSLDEECPGGPNSRYCSEERVYTKANLTDYHYSYLLARFGQFLFYTLILT